MNDVEYVHRFITSMVFTVAIETPILYILLRQLFRERAIESRSIIIVGILASFASIPYVWFVFPYLANWPRSTSLIFSESFVVVLEAVIYALVLRVNIWKAIFISLVANSSSYLLGPVLRSFGLWIYW